ncbi:hypothetical protein QEN19_002928 [Hanseniaspora menglaensis]
MPSSQSNFLLSTETMESKKDDYSKDPETIKLLTFNTWGLKKVSKFRNERFNEMINLISGSPSKDLLYPIYGLSTDSDYDIIALQEVWCENNKKDLASRLLNKYKSRFFSSGVITGPGLGIFSKFKIVNSWLYRFPINGVPWAVHRGDFYVGKSVAMTELNVSKTKHSTQPNNSNESVVILNSHMHAPYSQKGYNSYLCHRVLQAYDIYKLVTLLQQSGKKIVLVGDLNSKPGSLPYKIMTTMSGLVDSFVSDKFYTQNDITAMTSEEQVLLAGTTCDSRLNTWRAQREHWEACRLDYALIDPKTLRCIESKVQMTEQIPGIGSLSDHFGYSCVLKLEPSSPNLIHVPTVIEKQKILSEIISVIDEYIHVAKNQRLYRLSYFIVSIIIILASMIFVTFTSKNSAWSSVIVYIGGVFVLTTGLLNGIFGYVFGQSELRAIDEVKMEVWDELNALE